MNGINSPVPPTLAPTPGLLTTDMINECIEFFFKNMYPTVPILHRQRLERQAQYVDRDTETYCLMTSLCAFMMIQPGMPIPGDPLGLDSMPGANLLSGTMLMEETLRVRKGYDHLESPSQCSLITSYFLFGCYYGLDLHNKAWFHLREATTLAHILGMNKEETYHQFDMIDSSRRRRLYWLLFVTERAYALQRHRPLSLQATINLPIATDDPTEQQPPIAGFIHLVNVFRPFDDVFVALWNKTRTDCSPSYLSTLQNQLTESLPAFLQSTESQVAELRVSQQWLRTMVWQLSIQNGCLSSSHDDPSMTFSYPVEISRDLITMTSGFSKQSMEVHGIGLVEKLFDVACSLTDVLSLLPTPSDPFVVGPRDYLNQFLSLLSSLRNGDNMFLPLLLQKVHEVLPRLVSPMLQTVPESAASQMVANVDIFDGFGNAGMGISAQQFDTSKRIQELAETTNSTQNVSTVDNNNNNHNSHTSHSSQSPYSQEGAGFTSPPIMGSVMEDQLGFNNIDNYSYLHGDSIGGGLNNNITSNPLQQGGSMQSTRPMMRQQSSSFMGQLPQLSRSVSVQEYDASTGGYDTGTLPPGQMPLPTGLPLVDNLDHLGYR